MCVYIYIYVITVITIISGPGRQELAFSGVAGGPWSRHVKPSLAGVYYDIVYCNILSYSIVQYSIVHYII